METTDHQPLPVSGYKPQNQETVDLVNSNKREEELALRNLDALARRADIDQRWLAIGRTHLEQAYMAINRSIFQPNRIEI
jgi:hypothetical protein